MQLHLVNTVNEWDWLKSKLSDLMQVSNDLITASNIYSPARAWTPLKLILLLYYIDVYTRIIPRYFDNMFYLDLLAGAGIDEIKETGDKVAGSPVVASTFARKPFSKLFLMEMDRDRASALELRMRRILAGDKFEVLEGDANARIDDVLDHLRKQGSHYLAFVDCQGLDIWWDTMEKLLGLQGDIVFVHQTAEINRVCGRAKQSPGDAECLNRFYGTDVWEKADRDTLCAAYELNLRKRRGITIPIKIKSDSFHYDVVFATKVTRRGSPWLNAVYTAKEKVERFTGNAVKIALDILAGRSKEITWFFEKGT